MSQITLSSLFPATFFRKLYYNWNWKNDAEHSLLVVLLDLFMAGADTQSTTLSWAFLYMILNEKVQEKVQQEIDSQIGRDSPSFEHRKS